jgi:SNF2 family DNA or RNA helicase
MTMQVLHHHWLAPHTERQSPGLFIWAETAAAPQPARDRRKKSVQPHPFLTPVEYLAIVIHQVTGWRNRTFQAQTLTFWLPANHFGPCPSPELLHDWERDEGRPLLLPWLIKGLRLEAADAFQYLTLLPAATLPAVTLGSDGHYWQLAINLVLEMLAQQKMRPVLLAEKEGKREARYEARWQPVLDNEKDARRLAQLADAMPPLCRADANDPDQTMPARTILDTFVNQMVDAGARQWGTKQPLFLPASTDATGEWLRALFRPNPVLAGSTGQLQHLFSSYRAWERALTVAGDRHYRVAFRLEAPAQQLSPRQKQGEAAWQLHYLLQARDDASLIVPAAEVWQTKGSVLNALERRFDRPQERLLTGLGYAARFFAPIQRSLQSKHPTTVSLTGEEAFAFLRQCAPQLEQSGFGLLVPPWWNKPGTRLGVRLKLDSASRPSGQTTVVGGRMSLENLVHYRWELSLGDTTLSRQEFDALVALKSPLVQIRGQWVQLDPEQIEAAIRFWEEQRELEGEISLHEAMRLGLGGEATRNGLPVDKVELDGWLQQRLNQLQGDEKLESLSLPAGMVATLRPYQQYGYSWLRFAQRLGLGVILADDMGLGKTIQTLALAQRLKEEMGQLPAPLLLICPTSVVTNWQKESEKFTPNLTTLVHQGSQRHQNGAFVTAAQNVDIVLTSYALARRDEAMLKQVTWLGVVLDEAQNIKNANTKQARVIRSLPADFRLALTGTPVENRLSELWSILHFLNPGYLGSQTRFRERFAIPIERNGDQEAALQLRKLTRPFILRRVKTDPTVIQDLPDKQEVKVYCHLSEEQATLYEAVVRDGMQAIEAEEAGGIGRKGLVLSMLMQLKQICNHPAQYLHQTGAYNSFEDNDRSGKLGRLHALLDEILAEGDRLLIFSQFTEMAGLLKQFIQERFGVGVLYLHGGTPPAKRAEMVERFQQEKGGPPVFVLSLKAGGTGLNLTRANHVFHFDRWWNPAVENQATDRAFRIGQTRNVLVHKFVCLGTLEERIDQMIEDKKALAETIIGSGENWLTEMSTADLRALVKLQQDRSL